MNRWYLETKNTYILMTILNKTSHTYNCTIAYWLKQTKNQQYNKHQSTYLPTYQSKTHMLLAAKHKRWTNTSFLKPKSTKVWPDYLLPSITISQKFKERGECWCLVCLRLFIISGFFSYRGIKMHLENNKNKRIHCVFLLTTCASYWFEFTD